MKTISKRELNQQTAKMLAQVVSGKPLLVTERGVTRWQIEAVEANRDPVARMRRDGRIITAKSRPAPWPSGKARYTPAEIDALFADSRGEY